MIRAMTAPIEILRSVPLFANLPKRDLELLSRQMHERRFPEGSEVTTEGATGAGFFVIAEGNADVSVRGEHKTTIGPGDYFGEIALIAQGARTATVTAENDLTALGMTFWDFRPLVEDTPSIAWKLLQSAVKQYDQTQQ
jgi:CRP/FNR family transcriptional regulator, cyclic AMP receptor protein